MMNCKQATQMMSQSQDRPLIWQERIKLRFHLLMCNGCNNYNRHLRIISKTMKQLRDRF